jgi:hypothetical protein
LAIRKRDPAQIEASRERLGIAPDWSWQECEAGCGDIVWLPPVAIEMREQGRSVVFACTAECARRGIGASE